MKKYALYLLLVLIVACSKTKELKTAEQVAPATSPTSTMLGLLTSCKEDQPPALYKFNGVGFERLQYAEKVGKDSFQVTLPVAEPAFYYFGTDKSARRPVIFADDTHFQMNGNCQNMRGSVISGSDYNKRYDEVMARIKKTQQELQQKSNLYRQALKNPAKLKQAQGALAEMDATQKSYLDSMKRTQPFLAKIVALNTYLSFANNQGTHATEVDYYTSEFFKFVDLKDPAYNQIPLIFESFKSFSQTLVAIGMDAKTLQEKVDFHLTQIPTGSEAHRYALGGVVIALQAKNHPALPVFAGQFISQFEATTDKEAIAGLKKQMNRTKSLAKGSEAPDFTQMTPDGKPLSLSELRGKVVLIDFWASWCGPCRKENPNVVKLYNQYKDQGFEVLGVSLDRDKKRWLQAIEKDQLTWSHVSDLKGWKNEVAQDYSVRSIPHTVLVDREGNIIAKNLRGNGLSRKLKQIFKED